MATRLGFPAIPTPGRLDLRALQTAISNARQRIEQLEQQLGIITTSVQQSSQSGVASLQQLIQQLANLTARVVVLENAASTDIGTFLAGDDITIGAGVVPLSSTTVAQADPSDPTRIFGLIGVALNTAAAGQSVQVQRRGVYAPPGLTGLEVGRAIYADAAGLTQTPEYDATALPVGVAVSTTSIFIAPDFPALQYPAFSSGFADAYQNYMPVTYRMLQGFSSLEEMINALSYQSGADPNMMVPVTLDGNAVRVLAGDIAALAGLAVDLATLIDGLPLDSPATALMMVPVTLGGVAYRVTAGDIAALGGGPGGGGNFNRGAAYPNSGVALPANALPDTICASCPSDGTIQQWEITTLGGVGSIEFDVWKGGVGVDPGTLTAADSICGGNYPAIVTDSYASDAVMYGWDVAVLEGETYVIHPRTNSGLFTFVLFSMRLAP